MSPNVGNFVHDLVEMAKATERLPEIEAEVRNLTARNEALQKHNQGLEENILTYKSEIDRHLAIIRDLEVARDDAEFRFLELEERTGKALNFLADADRAMAAVKALIEGPKLEPKTEPQSKPEDGSKDSGDQRAPGELGPNTGSSEAPQQASSTDPSQRQSETLPTASSPDGSGSQPKIAPFDNVEKQESASTAIEALPPYTNKFYIDVQGYISRSDWLAGGGTDESYDL